MSATVAEDKPGHAALLAAIVLSGVLFCGCGGGSGGGTSTTQTPAAAPTITTTAAQNGAVIASLATTTSGATIYYTLDGSTPTNTSQIYSAPFLVASNLTVNALAGASGFLNSNVTSLAFTPNIPSGTLVWSDEFSNTTSANAQPNPQNWTYDVGTDCCGNNELETYCAWGSATAPCNPANPNAYADTSGILHIVARQPSTGVYTSARLKTQGLFSFQYGRIEARMMLPESQGMWPAFWLLGNSIASVNWPACGELDVMEHINGSNPQNEGYDWVQGSIHGTNLNGGIQYHPAGFSAAAWHTYGMIWSKGQIQYYVDSPSNIYATFTPSTQTGTWPFDSGPEFILLNLAIGGSWPGSPDATTVFPSEIQVDYVRLYTN
jgi:beta-glucanase (GH16 family)